MIQLTEEQAEALARVDSLPRGQPRHAGGVLPGAQGPF